MQHVRLNRVLENVPLSLSFAVTLSCLHQYATNLAHKKHILRSI